MATSTLTPAVGMTCTFGTGKTVWEIVKIENSGKQLHLSKVGGDGYTNRWAAPDEIRNLTPQTVKVNLATVLEKRAAAAHAAGVLGDQIKRHAKPAKVLELLHTSHRLADEYLNLYAEHLAETTGSEGAQ